MPIVMQRLKSAFLSSGKSYSELSTATGIPKATLQRYISGKTEKIPMDALESIASALNVSPAYLMGWRDVSVTADPESDYIHTVSESLQHNPKLGLLFDRSRKMSEKDLDAVLGIVDAILKERDPD